MRFFLLLMISIFLSCQNQERQNSEVTPDALKRFEPLLVTVEDNERIRAICNALLNKEDILDLLASAGTKYNFNYSEKKCSDTEAPVSKDIETTLVREGSAYFFRPAQNNSFSFQDVETVTRGVMSKICSVTTGLVSPIQTSSTGALWFTTFTASQHCQSDANGLCIHFQRGTAVDDFNYKIHTNEWIKFKLSNGNQGFFVERKLISSVGCAPKEMFEKKAILK